MSPLFVLRASPLKRPTAPLAPVRAVPELNKMEPLWPMESAFAVRTTKLPEEDTAPAPVTTATEPPTAAVSDVEPAATYTFPPEPLAVLPTWMDKVPARPDAAAPVWSRIVPLLPFAVVPDSTDNAPLLPADPTNPDATTTVPDNPDRDVPVSTHVEPELPTDVDEPVDMNKLPLLATAMPVVTDTDPVVVPAPLPMETAPVLPLAVVPVISVMKPEAP